MADHNSGTGGNKITADEEMMKLTMEFTEKVMKIGMQASHPSNELMHICAVVFGTLGAASASLGGIKDQPELDFKRRLLIMGNQSVAAAIQGLEDSGKMETLERMNRIRDILGGFGGNDPEDPDDDDVRH
jgi:hypothetical protein